MNEQKFWQLIDYAWEDTEDYGFRDRIIQGNSTDEDNENQNDILADFLESMEDLLTQLSKDELSAFDQILAKKLYDIDREDVHESLGGSDIAFLNARGFVVAMGKEYYDLVLAEPDKALYDFECEDITYLPVRIYKDKFDEDMPTSDIARETYSNKDAWSSRAK